MRRSIVRFALFAALVGVCATALGAPSAATWGFGAGEKATVPNAIKTGSRKIVVDLSALPKGAKVFRAVLRVRVSFPGWNHESLKLVVVPADAPDRPLELVPPRYRTLDATEAVTRAVETEKAELTLLAKSVRSWRREHTRLDVSFIGGAPRNKVPRVTKLAARHRDGQTLLTWTEPEPATAAEAMVGKEYQALRKKLSQAPRGVGYRVYRAARPITAATIAGAELVDEVGRLTCWNTGFHGIRLGDKTPVFRYVVEDGKKPVPPGTGIYAHNPPPVYEDPETKEKEADQEAYYALSVTVNGEEDLASFGKGNVLGPVKERSGPGAPILQRIERPETFFYTKGIALHYYTRWEAPPRCNLPSRPYDYLVTIPDKMEKPAPLNLVLHCWGSNLYGRGGGYTWHSWKDKRTGIGVASNQDPYDWWTTYHENRGTRKAWTEGVSRNFTPKRLLAFVDFVCGKWPVDKARICVSGGSMGGAGSTFIPIRYPERFAYAYSAVGIHDPARVTGGFHESYARVNGRMKFHIKHESGMPVWDYLSDPKIVRAHPGRDLPFIGFGNGKNDHGIGWPQAIELAKALQEARQPHGFQWNLRGHAAGAFQTGLDLRTDRSLPAFTGCSLDDDFGTATRRKEAVPVKMPWGQIMKDVYDGDHRGHLNGYLRWKTDDIVDEPAKWAMTVCLTKPDRHGRGGAPKPECTVNVTPRRLRAFRVEAGRTFKWTNTSVADKAVVQSGTAAADRWGLVTMKKVKVTQGGNRLTLEPAK
jgi:hypothetical protein